MLTAKTKEETVLFTLAEDAFDVMNWARRMRMKKDQQLKEVVSAFEKTLFDMKAKIELQH